MTKDELKEKTLQLILSGSNHEVINLLTDKILHHYSEPVFYLRRGLAYKRLEQHERAIADYNKVLDLNPNYLDAYHNRARVWDLIGEYGKAIADYNTAIEGSSDDAEYFNGRGVTWDNMGEFDKAIADYTRAIELDPEHLDANNNLGQAWQNKGNYEKALQYYAKTIELNPAYDLAYINRGTAYLAMGYPEKAMENYNKAIEVNPTSPYGYSHIGEMLNQQGKLDEAIGYYEKAAACAPYSKYFKKLLDEAKAKAGHPVDIESEGTMFSARYVESEITALTEEEKKPIRKACAIVNARVEQIRNLMVYRGTEPVVHYTQLRLADIVVMNKATKLRYSNVVFMNDPEEGKILTDFLLDNSLRAAFEKGKLREDNNIYLGSFLPEDKADYLVMWRTYGKNELKEEATGCSLTLHRAFFDKEDRGLYTDMRSSEIDPTERQALYHVMYYDKEKGALVKDGNKDTVLAVNVAMEKLKIELHALLQLKDKKDKNDEGVKNSAINKFVYRYVSELRYFFKSADYQFEKELRVIKYYMPGNEAVKTDTAGDYLPRRLYIESTNLVRPNLTKIILGPKVPHPERWMYLDAVMKQNGHTMKLEFSKCKFQ